MISTHKKWNVHGQCKKFASPNTRDTNMLVFFALGNAKVLSFALGNAKMPDASSVASQWNIGFRIYTSLQKSLKEVWKTLKRECFLLDFHRNLGWREPRHVTRTHPALHREGQPVFWGLGLGAFVHSSEHIPHYNVIWQSKWSLTVLKSWTVTCRLVVRWLFSISCSPNLHVSIIAQHIWGADIST